MIKYADLAILATVTGATACATPLIAMSEVTRIVAIKFFQLLVEHSMR
jgi:hypothetical protein